eukprot:jgi/Chlat1/4685/Chrsp3S05621
MPRAMAATALWKGVHAHKVGTKRGRPLPPKPYGVSLYAPKTFFNKTIIATFASLKEAQYGRLVLLGVLKGQHGDRILQLTGRRIASVLGHEVSKQRRHRGAVGAWQQLERWLEAKVQDRPTNAEQPQSAGEANADPCPQQHTSASMDEITAVANQVGAALSSSKERISMEGAGAGVSGKRASTYAVPQRSHQMVTQVDNRYRKGAQSDNGSPSPMLSGSTDNNSAVGGGCKHLANGNHRLDAEPLANRRSAQVGHHLRTHDAGASNALYGADLRPPMDNNLINNDNIQHDNYNDNHNVGDNLSGVNENNSRNDVTGNDKHNLPPAAAGRLIKDAAIDTTAMQAYTLPSASEAAQVVGVSTTSPQYYYTKDGYKLQVSREAWERRAQRKEELRQVELELLQLKVAADVKRWQ